MTTPDTELLERVAPAIDEPHKFMATSKLMRGLWREIFWRGGAA